MDSHDTIIFNQSERRSKEVRLRTDSATGILAAPHDEGSRLAGAVSSEMAITYTVKSLHRQTMVSIAASESNARCGRGSI